MYKVCPAPNRSVLLDHRVTARKVGMERLLVAMSLRDNMEETYAEGEEHVNLPERRKALAQRVKLSFQFGTVHFFLWQSIFAHDYDEVNE